MGLFMAFNLFWILLRYFVKQENIGPLCLIRLPQKRIYLKMTVIPSMSIGC